MIIFFGKFLGHSFRINADKIGATADDLNSMSATEKHIEQRAVQKVIPSIERSVNYERPRRKTASVRYSAKEPVTIQSNQHNGNDTGTYKRLIPSAKIFLNRIYPHSQNMCAL